jgi:hypothetical protein
MGIDRNRGDHKNRGHGGKRRARNGGKGLANGYEFANKADAGGKFSGEFAISGSTWVTKIHAQPQKLPRTGY